MWTKIKQFLKDFFLDERLISLVVVLFVVGIIGFGFLSGLILTIIVAALSSGLYWVLKSFVEKPEE